MNEKKLISARIDAVVKNWTDCDADTVDRLILAAYYMGRERATREVSDKYNAHLAEQRKRAAACRYHKMAADIIGPETYIYSPDYAGNVSEIFDGETTAL